MKTYTLEEITSEFIGKKGTPERDEFDAEVRESVRAYELGEVLRAERERMNMTQKELGEKAGIGESTVSKIEHGHSLSLKNLFGIARALDLQGSFLDMGRLGRVALM